MSEEKPPGAHTSSRFDGASEWASVSGCYEWSAADDRLRWSEGLLGIYGLTATPEGEAGFARLVHPEDRTRVEAETNNFLSSHARAYSHTFRIVRSDGAVRFILDRGVIERDARGRAKFIRGMNVDLTDLPNTGLSSAQDEGSIQRIAELEALYAEAPLGLAMLDSELRFVRINAALAQINGFSIQEHLGRRVWDLLPNLRNSAEPLLRQVFETGLPLRDVVITGETPAQPGEKREWREHFYPLRGRDGRVKGIGIVCEERTERIAAQRALAESEARLAAALRAGRLGVHEFDPGTGQIKWDRTIRRIWGVSDDEPISLRTFLAGLHPDDIAAARAAINAALDPDGPGRYEAEFRVIQRGTKAVTWVHANGDVAFDGRMPVRLVGTICDVTERRRVDDALALSERRFKLALAGSPITIFDQDRELRYEWVFNAKLGLSDSFALGKTDDEIVDPAAATVLTAFKRRVLESGEAAREEVFSGLPGQPAGYFDVHAHPRRDASGRVIGLTSVSTDITDRKLVEEALRESEERFRNMADNAPVMVWVTDRDGVCTYLSASWYEFTGQTPAEALGFGWLSAVHEADLPGVEQSFHDANERKASFQLDYRLRRADGAYRWAIDSARPRFDSRGEFLGFVGSVLDISERKVAEALRAFLLRLSDTLRSLRTPREIQAEAARLLRAELAASRTAYYEVAADFSLARAVISPETPSISGGDLLASSWQTLVGRHRRGETIAVSDVQAVHSDDEVDGFGRINVAGYVSAPIVQDGQFIAGFVVHSTAPRPWTRSDVRLVEETAERTWAAADRARAEEERRQSEARYRTLFEAIDEGFCVIEVRFDAPDGRVDYRVVEANPAFYRLTGFPDSILGRWLREAAPELEEHWYDTYGRVARTGEPSRFERHSDALGRWFDVYAFPMDQTERRVAVLFTEISARKRHEEHIQLLMSEGNHRAKNMLSLVGAIARQTAVGTPEDFLERFEERIGSLAASQDLLLRSDWRGAELSKLIEEQFSHFRELLGDRIKFTGPMVEVAPKAAQTLGMALHELATNAAKYGALSNADGCIDIVWEVTQDSAEPCFSMSWTETNGPEVVPPTRVGFGQRVAKSVVEHELSAEVSVAYPKTGFVWTLKCPLDAVRT